MIVHQSLFGQRPPQALTENHNVVPSFSPGLPREAAATLGGTSQNSTADCEAARSAKSICLCPIRPISHIRLIPLPKSTVDLGCGPLIKVENGLKPPLSPTSYRPIIRPENKGIKRKSNRHRPKNFTISLCVWWPSARTGRADRQNRQRRSSTPRRSRTCVSFQAG